MLRRGPVLARIGATDELAALETAVGAALDDDDAVRVCTGGWLEAGTDVLVRVDGGAVGDVDCAGAVLVTVTGRLLFDWD